MHVSEIATPYISKFCNISVCVEGMVDELGMKKPT